MSLHIYLAVPVLILVAWHGWRMNFIFKVDGSAGRRLVLNTGALAFFGWWFWQGGNWIQRSVNRASLKQRFTGSYLWESPTGRFPVTSWIFDYPDPINPQEWRLTVSGLVQEPLSFTLDQLKMRSVERQEVLLDCTSGWYTVQTWRGVRLGDLLAQAGLEDGVLSINVRAVSGYQRRFPLEEAKNMILALDVAERPLSHGHGFPLRLVAPHRRGFEWVKWVSEIQVSRLPAQAQPPLPLR